MRPLVSDFLQVLPASLGREPWNSYADAVDSLRVDNLGTMGTTMVLGGLGVDEPDDAFRARALDPGGLPGFGRLTAEVDRGGGVALLRTRVVSYAECNLSWPGGNLRWSGLCENSRQEDPAALSSRWLLDTAPPFNAFADRRTCSEFRFFDWLIESLALQGMAAGAEVRAQVRGELRLVVSAPPCVSCLGVIRQFQLLFPAVSLEVAGGPNVQ